jgi:hypothetical protein
MMKTSFLQQGLLAVSLVACGKSSDKPAGKAEAPQPTIDVAAVNALVPADLKAKLEFAKTDVVEPRGRHTTTYTLAAPKGWKADTNGFAKLKPVEDLGFFTDVMLGSNCDGSCEPKDWAKVADKVNFAQFDKDKVIKNETSPTSRLLIAERDGKTTFVVYAWWVAGAKRYHSCMATLDEPVKSAGEAFAKACQAVAISGED